MNKGLMMPALGKYLTGMALSVILYSCSNNGANPETRHAPGDSVSILLQRSASLPDSLSRQAYRYAERALYLAQKNAGSSGMSGVFYNAGVQAERAGNYDLAATYFLEAVGHGDGGNPAMTGNAYNHIAQIAFRQGKNSIAMEYFPKALAIRKKLDDKKGQASSYLNIGSVYQKEGKYSQAEEQYRQSLGLYSELSDEQGKANCFNNLGGLYLERDMHGEALEFYRQAEGIYREQHLSGLLFSTLSNIGLVYSQAGNVAEARSHYLEALRIAQRLPSAESAVARTYCTIGMFYEELNRPDSALFYFNNAIDMASGANLYEVLETALKERSILHARESRYRDAYNDYVAYKHAYDAINNEETVKAFTQKSMQYEFDIRQQAQLYRNRMQRAFIIALIVVILLVCVLAVNYYRNYVRKKKDNLLLARQKEEITDSIRYAGLIQKSTLPPKEYADSILPRHFVFSRPRDIVSGDFYWMTRKECCTIVAVADCTGHGVPGAIVSMLGISSLNKIVSKMKTPKADEILNLLREEIVGLLNPEGSTGATQDGMDIALVIIDRENNELEYAGAYNPLYLIRGNTLIEKKADKMPIGLFVKKNEPFSASRFPYFKDDAIYLFSDGYSDQFGGTGGEKFKTKRFKELLLAIHEQPMEEQYRMLCDTHLEWKGNDSQIDDILVLGIKL